MRRIDADALKQLCDDMIQETWNSKTAPVSWANAYADFKDAIDSMPTITPSGWVSVEDRLPNFGKLVIATDGTTYGIAWYCSDCTWMIKMGYKSESWIGRKVTHWMPLPEPPKED